MTLRNLRQLRQLRRLPRLPRLSQLSRPIATLALAGLVSVAGASCSIPTEDQPQPITREQTTTSVAGTP